VLGQGGGGLMQGTCWTRRGGGVGGHVTKRQGRPAHGGPYCLCGRRMHCICLPRLCSGASRVASGRMTYALPADTFVLCFF